MTTPEPPADEVRLLALPTSEPANSTLIRNMDGTRKEERVETLSQRWKRWRRGLKALFPYVRRREFEIMSRLPNRLIDDLNLRTIASDAVTLEAIKAPDPQPTRELCLFVTHAPRATLKTHVVLHLEQMLAAGVPVVLIINTTLDLADIQIDASLLQRLRGVYVRGNRGYDFAAWAHVWKAMDRIPGCERLYLVNDSIVGPLDDADFRRVIERIRQSPADLVGLTDAPEPRLHLQSYFLVIQGRALRSTLFTHFFENVLCLPTKEWVVVLYEIRLTEYLQQAGMAWEALFTGPKPGGYTVNDSLHRWAELIESGYPYIKTRILTEEADNPRMKALVPAHLRSGS